MALKNLEGFARVPGLITVHGDGGRIRATGPKLSILWTCCLLALPCLLASQICNAQQAPDRATLAEESSAYRRAIEEAVAEFQRANWNEAIVLFRRAHRLRPSPKTHRGLGQSYFEARDYVNAIPHLRAALRSPQSFTPEQQDNLSLFLERSLSFVGAVKLQLSPPEASILLDGVEVEMDEDAQGEPLWLNPGSHTLLVNANGYRPLQQQLAIEGGTERTLRVALLPERMPVSAGGTADPDGDGHTAEVAKAQIAPQEPAASQGSDTSSALQTAAWVSAGIAVTGLVASVVLWRLREDGPVVDWYDKGCNTDDSAYICTKLSNEADSLKAASTITGVASGVMAAGALTLLMVSLVVEEDDAPPDERAMRCLPGVGSLQCGMRF